MISDFLAARSKCERSQLPSRRGGANAWRPPPQGREDDLFTTSQAVTGCHKLVTSAKNEKKLEKCVYSGVKHYKDFLFTEFTKKKNSSS